MVTYNGHLTTQNGQRLWSGGDHIVLEGSREGFLEEVSNKLHFRERRNFLLSPLRGVKGRVFQADPTKSGNERSQHSTSHIFLLLLKTKTVLVECGYVSRGRTTPPCLYSSVVTF